MAPIFTVLDFSRFLKKYRDLECRRISSYVLKNNYMDYRQSVQMEDVSFLDNTYAKKLIARPLHALKGAHSILDYAMLLWDKYSKIDSYLNESINHDDNEKAFERAAAIIKKRDEILQMLKVIKIQLIPYYCGLPTLPYFLWDFGIDPILNPNEWNKSLIEASKTLNYKKCVEWDFLSIPAKTIVVMPKDLFLYVTTAFNSHKINPCAFVFSEDSFKSLEKVLVFLGSHNDKYFVFRDVCDTLMLVFRKDEEFYILTGYYDNGVSYDSVKLALDKDSTPIANQYISKRQRFITNANVYKSNILVYCF